MSPSVTALCMYRVKAGKETEFEDLLRRHWQTLRKLELVPLDPPQTFKGEDKAGGTMYAELLTWNDARTPERAHEIPEVIALWEPMGALCESRRGLPAMDFPHVKPLSIHRR